MKEFYRVLKPGGWAIFQVPFFPPIPETTFEDFEQVYKTNVFGVSEMTRTVLPFVKQYSHVVTISSMGGIQGSMKFPGLSAYSSSKGAVITLTELLAEEYKETGPQFNVLALGAVQTEMLKEAFPDYEAPTTALEMARHSANLNNLKNIEFSEKEACVFLSEHSRKGKRGALVDIDPFGSPAEFFDCGIRATVHGGMLSTAATDLQVLNGLFQGACKRKYGGIPVRVE